MDQTHPRWRVRRGTRAIVARSARPHRAQPSWNLESVESRIMLDGTFTGTYFNDTDLTNPGANRQDPLINFSWAKAAPADGVDPSTFSARWTGRIKPAHSETYTFHTTADDGVRLWVNGQLLVDRWSDRPSLVGDLNADGTVNFTDYQILERKQGTNDAQSDLNSDGIVDFVDFRLLYDNLYKTLPNTTPANSGTIALTGGQTYELRLEYYQNSDQASVKLEWQSASQARQVVPAADPETIPDPGGGDDGGTPGDPGGDGTIIIGNGNGLLGTYFDNMDFTGPSVSRVDPQVNFRWDGYRPTSRIDTTTFSVRWEGQIQAPVSGDYTFYVRADDGFRLWVRDLETPLMDFWGDQTESPEPYASDTPITLIAGRKYNFRFEYYQNQGNSMVELGWGGPFAQTLIPTAYLFPGTGTSVPPTQPPPPTEAAKGLKVSPDGHFLQKADGSPFYWLADTAWSLFNRTSRADVDYYLQNRADKEFTVTQAVLYNPDAARTNAFRQPVFLNDNPATPNPAYFDHVDYTLDKAQSVGMYVALLPTWGDAVGANDGRRVFNTENAYSYGLWLGQRYAGQANIIWVLGGDWPAATADVQAVWRAMAQGLGAGDGGTHLITYHPIGGKSSTDFFPQSETWLDFNLIQSGHTRNSANYNMIAADYAASPAKPVLDFEPNYENFPNNWDPDDVRIDDYDVRKKTYWALFAGAFGASYGNWEVYGFSNSTTMGRKPWREALDYPGAGQMKYAKRLIASRPYVGRVPDQALLAGDTLSGTDHIRATRGGDGSYAFVYSAGGKAFTVDLTRLTGTTIKASWFDPRTGAVTAVGEFARSGTRSFTPPTSGYGQDWVLVLDDKARNYSTAGQLPPPPPPNSNPLLTGSVEGRVTDGTKSIPYRLYKPTGVAPGQKVPLILMLHGRDDRGTDNVKPAYWARGIVANTKSGPYAAYVLVPQIDTSMWFQSYNGSPTVAMKLTIQALKQVMATENVDPTRVYVTGLSMGGMGAWDAIRWEPNLFAAAVPMSGNANPNTASQIKHVPIWAFHGSNDTIVPVSGSRNMINALRAAGGSPRYTEVAGGGHVIWDPLYFDNSGTLYPWLFAQRLPVPATGSTVAPKPSTGFSTKPVKKVEKPKLKQTQSLFSSTLTTTTAVKPVAKKVSAGSKK